MKTKGTKSTLIVFCPLYPPSVGGLQNHAEEWNSHMASLGYNIIIFTPQLSAQHPPEEHSPLISTYRFPAFEIISNYPIPKLWHPRFWQLFSPLHKGELEGVSTIIVSRTRFFLTSLMALIYSKLTHTPWLHIEHGSDFVQLTNPFINTLARLYDHTLGRLTFQLADALVANSQASASFVKKFTNHPVHIIYRGMEIEKIEHTPPSNPKSYKLEAKSCVITYAGRLISGKGVADLLNAVYSLPTTHYQLVIIGSGPELPRLQQLTKQLEIEDRVTFLGEMSHEQTIAHIKTSDIIVNPSYSEGLPTSLIEAALCGKAIVATNVGGTAEIITHNHSGLLYPARGISTLSSHLQTLINNPQLHQKLGQTAHQTVQNRFTWQATIPHYETLLQQVCDDRRSSTISVS